MAEREKKEEKYSNGMDDKDVRKEIYIPREEKQRKGER